MAQMSTLSSAKLFANPCELNGKIEWWISMELVPSCGGAVCSCRGDWTCESAAAGAGGGGGEGLFPLRCVTALAAADCRRLAGVSAAVSECSHPSASYHPHWRICFEACSSATKSFNVWLMQCSVLKSVTISHCIYYDNLLQISYCRTVKQAKMV